MSYAALNLQDKTAKVLAAIPQQPPFRFIDRIVELDDQRIVAQYTFKPDEYFYQGHFPGNPVTPGVVLIEAMAQATVVALGLHLVMSEGNNDPSEFLTLFTDVNAEFLQSVLPGETVTIKGERLVWRRRKLQCKAELYLANGTLAASATLSGLGVKRP